MSWLPMLAICSPVTLARSPIPGTARMRESTEKAPALYPASPAFGCAPAMVPPVARITTFGFAGARSWAKAEAAAKAATTVGTARIRRLAPLILPLLSLAAPDSIYRYAGRFHRGLANIYFPIRVHQLQSI
jgi:hypothetical protein